MMIADTLTDLMVRRAAADPDLPYFTLFGETVTYQQLWARSERYAGGLRKHGIDQGDTVCLIYPT
jgi:acyl-CoA synthetase (AMP-forming)/AMP-acid ligase II